MARSPGRTTIQDIAIQAATSTATVSRVLSKSGYPVRPELRRRILEIAASRDYAPNAVSQMLRQGFTRDIGVIVPTISNPFYAQLLLGVELEARQADFNILICNSFRDTRIEERAIENLVRKQAAGILISTLGDNQDLLEKVQRKGTQIVAFDQNIDSQICNQVGFNFMRGGMLAAEHLAGLGHRRIAFLTTPLYRRSRRELLEGFRLALLRQDQDLPADYLLETVREEESASIYELAAGRDLAARFLALSDRPTALAVVNDLLAMSILQQFALAGLRVPQDVSVIGFDDLPLAALLTPALTTIRQPALEMGRMAFRILRGQITAGSGQPDHHPDAVTMLLEPELVIRQTTAALN
jgi:LacI family transcriptional regulator